MSRIGLRMEFYFGKCSFSTSCTPYKADRQVPGNIADGIPLHASYRSFQGGGTNKQAIVDGQIGKDECCNAVAAVGGADCCIQFRILADLQCCSVAFQPAAGSYTAAKPHETTWSRAGTAGPFRTCRPRKALVSFRPLCPGRTLDARFSLGSLGAWRTLRARITLVPFSSLTAGVPFFLFLRRDVDICVSRMGRKFILCSHGDSIDCDHLIHDYYLLVRDNP